jgi:hypothetical protein
VDPADLTARWLTWWSAHSGLSPQALLLLGLADQGLPISTPLNAAAFPSLIAAQTATPPATARAAHALLTDLTGYAAISPSLPPTERHKLWTAWLAKQRKAPKPKPKKKKKSK